VTLRRSDCPSVIPYYGGKYEMSKRLIKMLPPHRRYFEPFFGGGSLYFRKPKSEWNVLNDIDSDLVNLYICVANEFDKFSKHVYWYVRSRELYETFVKEIKNNNEFAIPDPERASKYFFIVRNAFNNVAYGSFSKDCYWKTKMIDELKMSREKLNEATIENMDYRKLIDRYEVREGDFFYFDPPYVIADTKKYYRNNFTNEMHIEMSEYMDKINSRGGTFMISYDDIPYLRSIYSEYNLNTIDTLYLGSNVEKRSEVKTELLITNYEIQQSQIEIF